jgi:hypothetical protein
MADKKAPDATFRKRIIIEVSAMKGNDFSDLDIRELNKRIAEKLATTPNTVFQYGDELLVQIDSIGRGPGPVPPKKTK